MAIYHYSVQIIGRSKGQSSIAAAAYRSGEKLRDHQTGEEKDFTRKDRVDHKEILVPENSPAWATDREELWNRVELAEKRKDAQLCREINVALPREILAPNQKHFVRKFVQENFVACGMVADIALHDLDGDNPHAHIMLTTREIGPEGFGKKVRAWNDKALLQSQRAAWAEHCNRHLERTGQKIDHRSLEAQGIDRRPQIHLGPKPAPERIERYEAIERANEEISLLVKELQDIEAEIERESDPAVVRRREEDELLKELGLTDSAQAGLRLKELEHRRESAKRARDRAKKAIEDFNNRFDNMNLFKKMNPFSNMHRAGQALEDEWEKHDKHHNFLEKEKENLQKGYEILWERERPELERKDSERKKDFERDKRIRQDKQKLKEKQRVLDKGRDFER